METGTYRDRQIFANIIPILPTRHGNSGFPGMKGGKVVDSDPTYEAWKRDLVFRIGDTADAFRSYLRGMETCVIR